MLMFIISVTMFILCPNTIEEPYVDHPFGDVDQILLERSSLSLEHY